MSLSWNTAADWLLHSAAGGGLLLLLTCLLIQRTRQPAQRQRLGELGLGAALVLALLSLRSPWLVLPWPGSGPAPEPVAVRDQAAQPEELADAEMVFVWPAPPGDFADEPAFPVSAPAPQEAAPASAPAHEPASPSWQSVAEALLPFLVVVYALVAIVLLARWMLGYGALARLLRNSMPAPPVVAELFADITPGKRRPRLLVSRQLRVPISCGLVRPTIVLPAALCVAPDLQKLRWVFAHELTHLERRDAWSALLFALGQAVYFFLPWFGWLRRQVRLCQEYVADAAAAGQDEPAVDYAAFLVSLSGAPAVPPAASAVSGNCSDLYRRVNMLLKEPLRVEKRCPRRWSLLAAAALFSLAVLAAGVGLRADAAPQVIVILPGEGEAHKQTKPEEARKARVLVVPAPEKGAAPGTFHRLNTLPPLPPGTQKPVTLPVDPKTVQRFGLVLRDFDKDGKVEVWSDPRTGKQYFVGVQRLQLEKLRKALDKLERHRGTPDLEELRTEIHKALERLPNKATVRAQRVVELQKEKTDKKAEQGMDSALNALRKALEKLGQQPELESARQQLKRAIEQIEKAKNLHQHLDFFPPAKALVEKALVGPGKVKAEPGAIWECVPQVLSVPGGRAKTIDRELLKKVREEVRNKNYAKAEELLRKALEEAQPKGLWMQPNFRFVPPVQPNLGFPGMSNVPFNRFDLAFPIGQQRSGGASLGLAVQKPSAALADQLNLPSGKGVIITGIEANSAAAKAGFKVNDVLLKLDGRTIANDPAEFARIVKRIKTNEAFNATVLRKGKEETIKGIRLAEQPGVVRQGLRGALALGQGGVMTTLLRNGDRFTTRYQEGSLIITLTGTVADEKARVSEITIQDGQKSNRYDSVERVPAKYRDKVNHLIAISGRGAVPIERK